MSTPSQRTSGMATVMRPSAESQRLAEVAASFTGAIDKAGEGNAIEDRAVAPTRVGAADYQTLLASFRLDHGAIPPLVVGAAPLLALAHSLFHAQTEPDITALRDVAVAAVRDYERDLAGARIAPERARAAHYVVCALVDDVVLSRPWGIRGNWARSGLVSTFHMDVTGGERVFDLLDHFHRNPGANKDLLLLIYLCLSLGFEGRTRIAPRGALELMRIRDGLYRTLRGQFGSVERELSPHWRGENSRHKPLRNLTVLWTLLGVLLLVLALGYLIFTLALNSKSDTTLASFASLAPETPTIVAFVPPPPPKVAEIKKAPPPPPPPPPPPDPFTIFANFLQPEVEQKLVWLTRKDRSVLVRINNAGLFDSGSADVKPAFRDLLTRIGSAIAAENFRAVVIGHTDNVAIRTVQYPSNWTLSEDRARSVASILSGFTGPGVITSEGRADTEPVAENTTPEGRAANRRTEILVIGAAARSGFRSPVTGPEPKSQ